MSEFEKPSSTEEEYFAREEIEKKRRLALKQADEMATAEKNRLKALHYMHCPKCGMKLQTVRQGPAEQVVKKEEEAHPIMEAILNWFKRT
jgi:dTDP-4-dehydrorhamnose 3,5-epimerase-like enzyme